MWWRSGGNNCSNGAVRKWKGNGASGAAAAQAE